MSMCVYYIQHLYVWWLHGCQDIVAIEMFGWAPVNTLLVYRCVINPPGNPAISRLFTVPATKSGLSG